MTPDPAPAASWNRRHWLILVAGLAVAAMIRAALFPLPGLAGDMDEFATWVQGLTSEPFGQAYDRDLTFPPVMVYLWGALAVLVPAFSGATDASDPAVRIALKLLPTIADAGLVAGVAFALRGRPWWAVAGALSIALHPAVIDVSALFGQYESIYVLFGLGAYLLAIRNHSHWAAVVLALALMTKPQALPFVVPFGAWFVARHGWLGAVRLGAICAATIVVLWLPFVADGGPAGYLRNVMLAQNELYAVLSLRAWNPWWILQVTATGGEFASDTVPIVGSITLRLVGIAVTTVLELLVFLAILRGPTPARLAWGLVAASLLAFVALTTMHERYAYPALVFLVLLFPDRRALALWAVFSVAFTLNLLGAVPPSAEIGAAIPGAGVVSVAGSLAITACALIALAVLTTTGATDDADGAGTGHRSAEHRAADREATP